jgi:hypothetical protein
MANTMTLISSVTVGSGGASSIVFSSIPSTYTDLVVKISGRTNYSGTVEGSTITFNGSNTYSTKYLQGDGANATSGSQSILNAALFDGSTATSNTFGNAEFYIPNYTSSNQKSVSGNGVQENNNAQGFAGLFAGLASLTSAITSITIAGNAGGSFVQYSTAYLYGVKNA